MAKKSTFKDPMGHHIRLYAQIYDSAAFKALSPVDVVTYLALRRDLKSTNNGDLSLTLTKAKERGISHHNTLARSLRALCAVGLICLTRKGGSQRGGQRLPSLYGMTDVDVYAMPQKQVEARKADDAWRKVSSAEQGRNLIEQADAAVKKTPEKLKSLGHQMTVTRTPTAMKTATTRTPTATWPDRPGHLVSYGKTASNPTAMRVPGQFEGEQVFENHRTPAMPPIQIATPVGELGACSDADTSNYHRLTKPTNGRDWLPAGLVDREAVPASVTRKALKKLATLPNSGPVAEIAIQAARGAGVTIEQLTDWADPVTVARALAGGSRHWQDLWTATLEESL
jgi:hypothetical protein